MVAQFQFQRVGIQVLLLHQVGFPVFSDVMIYQGHGHYQRYCVVSELDDNIEQFLLFIGADQLLEKSHHVLQHVDVFLDCWFKTHGRHQQFLIALDE